MKENYQLQYYTSRQIKYYIFTITFIIYTT